MAIKSKGKYLFVISNSEIGGTELQILKTAKLINTRGHTSQVWVLGANGPLNDLAASLNVPIENFNLNIKKSKLLSIFQLFKLGIRLRKDAFDIAHAFLPETIMLILPIVRIFAPSTKRIAGIRGSLQKSNYLIDFFFRLILNDSWRIICNAEYLDNHLKNKFRIDSRKIRVIRNGVERIDIRNKTRNKIPHAIVIANFHSYKGHLMLLQVLSRINANYRTILCGSGVLKDEISRSIIKLGLSSKVTINSSINNVMESIEIADFAIHPSETEGLSNAILEEISAGLPVVAFNVGGNQELVTSGLNGFLIDPFNLIELQTRIEELINDNELRKKMSLAAVHKSKDFSWDVHIDQLLHVYQDEFKLQDCD
jgi:glycosyltransferase involved in cell wall biosynthesis